MAPDRPDLLEQIHGGLDQGGHHSQHNDLWMGAGDASLQFEGVGFHDEPGGL